MIVREIQDLASTIDEAAKAFKSVKPAEGPQELIVKELTAPSVVVNVPEQQPPVVEVNVPEQQPPVINVAPAEPNITVERADPVAYRVTITARDRDGFISEFTIVPMIP